MTPRENPNEIRPRQAGKTTELEQRIAEFLREGVEAMEAQEQSRVYRALPTETTMRISGQLVKRCISRGAISGLQCQKAAVHVVADVRHGRVIMHKSGPFTWGNTNHVPEHAEDRFMEQGSSQPVEFNEGKTAEDAGKLLKNARITIDGVDLTPHIREGSVRWMPGDPPFDGKMREAADAPQPVDEALDTDRMETNPGAYPAGMGEPPADYEPWDGRPVRVGEVRTYTHPALTELADWWRDVAESEIDRTVPKAMEYSATDLADIGHVLARTAGRTVSDEEAAELGIFFYLQGKLSRWAGAVMDGRRPSDDTIFDMGIYIRMAQRVRATGAWPGIDLP